MNIGQSRSEDIEMIIFLGFESKKNWIVRNLVGVYER